MKNLFVLGILTMVIMISSCNKVCIKGEGQLVKDTREVLMFSKVKIDLPCNLMLTNSINTEVVIEAEKNILALIKTEVKSNTLIISSVKCLDRKEFINIIVSAPQYKELEFNNNGNVKNDNILQADKLKILISGSGNINLNTFVNKLNIELKGSGDAILLGATKELNINIKGSGNVDASKLNAFDADLSLSGSGNINVFANNKLNADVKGSGNVYYKGSPKLSVKINGTGKVEKQQ